MNRILLLLVVMEAAVIALLLWNRDAEDSSPVSSPERAAAPAAGGPPELLPDPAATKAPAPELRSVLPRSGGGAEDALGITLCGAITSQSGTVVEGAWVKLTDADDTLLQDQNTGAQGYAVNGLRPGKWRLHAGGEGYVELRREVEIAPQPEVQRLDLVLMPVTRLWVRFRTPEGQELEHLEDPQYGGRYQALRAVASREQPPPRLPLTLFDAVDYGVGEFLPEGAWSDPEGIPPGCAGELAIEGPLPVYVSAVLKGVVLTTVAVPAGASEVTLVISPARIEQTLCAVQMCVLDELTGAPAAAGYLEFGDAQGGGLLPLGDAPAQPAAGCVRLANQPPGLLELHLDVPGHEDWRTWVNLEPGQTLDLGTVRLGAGVSISGVVRDAAGRPLAGARIWPRDLELLGDPPLLDLRYAYESEADGSFRLEHVRRSRIALYVEQDGAATSARLVDTRSGPVEGLELRVLAGTPVRFDVQLPPDRGYQLRVTDAAGMPVLCELLDRSFERQRRMPPGSYSVELLTDTGTPLQSLTLDVGDAPAELRIRP